MKNTITLTNGEVDPIVLEPTEIIVEGSTESYKVEVTSESRKFEDMEFDLQDISSISCSGNSVSLSFNSEQEAFTDLCEHALKNPKITFKLEKGTFEQQYRNILKENFDLFVARDPKIVSTYVAVALYDSICRNDDYIRDYKFTITFGKSSTSIKMKVDTKQKEKKNTISITIGIKKEKDVERVSYKLTNKLVKEAKGNKCDEAVKDGTILNKPPLDSFSEDDVELCINPIERALENFIS